MKALKWLQYKCKQTQERGALIKGIVFSLITTEQNCLKVCFSFQKCDNETTLHTVTHTQGNIDYYHVHSFYQPQSLVRH